MRFQSLSAVLLWDLFLVLATVAAALVVKRVRAKRGAPLQSSSFDSGRTGLVIGCLFLLLSFVWCYANLSVGATDIGIVVGPALVMAALGWVIVSMTWSWMHRHVLLVFICGVLGVVMSGVLGVGSAALLSPKNATNIYWVICPPIILSIISIFAMATSGFIWFYRATGVISDK